ncbi:MAG: uridine phosphorylase [Alphaproteobacteria bacterium]|nr:uridine phosphorylase [Alphaproteobacteria bacterium]
MARRDPPPILADKHPAAPSVFTPEGLLREARRQKGIGGGEVPSVVVLDPDGDVLRRLVHTGAARRDPNWACYHTELHRVWLDEVEIGLIACAVGAPFAVLLAEELFASGCLFLINMTSAGQLTPLRPPPYFVLIDKALRDEGTSYHYLPPAPYAAAPASVLALVEGAFADLGVPVIRGATWTTDAPFRETEEALAAMRERGILAVEMEAAALYAFAEARGRDVLCFAHVTNQMARVEGDFEKGEADGTVDALAVILATARRFFGKMSA